MRTIFMDWVVEDAALAWRESREPWRFLYPGPERGGCALEEEDFCLSKAGEGLLHMGPDSALYRFFVAGNPG